MPTAFLIALSDALWAVVAGSIVLALLYGAISKSNLLYTNILSLNRAKNVWSKTRTAAILVALVSVLLCFAVGVAFIVDSFLLLPLVLVAAVATLVACH